MSDPIGEGTNLSCFLFHTGTGDRTPPHTDPRQLSLAASRSPGLHLWAPQSGWDDVHSIAEAPGGDLSGATSSVRDLEPASPASLVF